MPDSGDSPTVSSIEGESQRLVGLIRRPKTTPADTPGQEETGFQTAANQKARRELLKNDSLEQDIALRKRFAYLFFILAVGWLFGVFGVVLLQGFKFLGFGIGEGEMIALLTTTTVNIVSLLAIVASYIFPKPRQDQTKAQLGTLRDGAGGAV